MKRPRRVAVESTGKKPPASGVTKGKKPSKTAFQKLLEGWSPKGEKKKG